VRDVMPLPRRQAGIGNFANHFRIGISTKSLQKIKSPFDDL